MGAVKTHDSGTLPSAQHPSAADSNYHEGSVQVLCGVSFHVFCPYCPPEKSPQLTYGEPVCVVSTPTNTTSIYGA
jgi:hypothetical protein